LIGITFAPAGICQYVASSSSRMSVKGKPVARRGRKASGLWRDSGVAT
jgi:uncharacterized Zn-binding protein involved in type VI secretion